MGFDPKDREEAFFRLLTYRYGCKSILITTNKNEREWTELLACDEVLMTAIPDQLLYNAQHPRYSKKSSVWRR